MLKRIQVLFSATCIFILACCNSNNTASTKNVLKDTLENIIRTYAYTNDGWVAANNIFKSTSNKEVADSLQYYSYCAAYYRQNNNFPLQLTYADSSLSIINKNGFENTFNKERAIAYISKAHALFYLKRFEDCYYYYCLGSIEANKLNDSVITEDLNNHLTLFLYEEGNYPKAIFYYKKALVDVTGKNKTIERLINNQAMLDNIGISYLKEKKADSAIIQFDEALQIIKEIEALQNGKNKSSQICLGVVYGNLAQAYVMTHNFAKAEQIFQESIAINSQPGYAKENALITQQQLAALYYKEKKMALLYNTLYKVKNGLDTMPNNDVALKWNCLMSRYYAATNQPQKALSYLDTYIALNSEKQMNTKLGESDILDQMSIMQSNYEMSLLKKDNEINKGYLWAFCIFSMLVVVIAAILLINFKKSKKSITKLTILNSEIQQKQTLLNETLADLEKQNVEKQHILHVVAHDLRNPLSAIHTLAGVVLNEYEYEEDNREYLQLIRSACMDSNQLINSILEIAENTDVKYNFELVDVNDLLASSIQLSGMKASEKNQHIELITSQEKGLIYADTEKINRVFGNLLTNAIKFSPSGSCIEISAAVSEHHVMVKVKDNGIGIPEKYHDKIFNAFTDAKRAGTAGEKTFGLGLSITKQIVEKHHGRIWFESMENKGTTFFVQFSKLENTQLHAGDEASNKTTLSGS